MGARVITHADRQKGEDTPTHNEDNSLNWIVSVPLCVRNNVMVKPSLHNNIITVANYSYIQLSNMFRPYSAIIRLKNSGVSQVVMQIFSLTTECTLTNTAVCKPDDGRVMPKHFA